MTRRLLLPTLFLLFWQSGAASEIDFRSSVDQVGLLELYTSEGCSSCPPADRWLSGLLDEEYLWTEVIPLAFHVDYWDYLGWVDRFASAEFSERQREYSRQGSVPTVYTPEFILNGHEWRNWFVKRALDFTDGGRPGVLTMIVTDGVAEIRFQPTMAETGSLEVNVALLGFGMSTKVRAGENAGRELEHDFVVLGVRRVLLEEADDAFETAVELPESRVVVARRAAVAWVTRTMSQASLQAVGGWLSDDP